MFDRFLTRNKVSSFLEISNTYPTHPSDPCRLKNKNDACKGRHRENQVKANERATDRTAKSEIIIPCHFGFSIYRFQKFKKWKFNA